MKKHGKINNFVTLDDDEQQFLAVVKEHGGLTIGDTVQTATGWSPLKTQRVRRGLAQEGFIDTLACANVLAPDGELFTDPKPDKHTRR